MPPRFGYPLNVRVRSSESVLLVEPTLGVSVDQPSVDAPLGSTPESMNYLMREGGLEPRPCLSVRAATPQPLGNTPILGGTELVSVTNLRYPIASGTSRWAVYGQAVTPNGWSVLSYVSSYGIDAPPALAATDAWHYAQIYDAARDETWLVGAPSSYQTLYVTQSDTTVFSTLTGAPAAKFIAAYDNYLIGFNLRAGGADLVQRVQWNDRGSASSWTGGLAGFEDLLTMRGQGTGIVPQDNRLILFSDEEIWQGASGSGPFVFQFAPYDTSRGSPYPQTLASTPIGLIWLGKDYQLYLLPKGGGPSQPIGQRFHRTIRAEIDTPARAWAVYNNTLSQYQLHYPVKGGSGYPEKAVYLDIGSGAWAPQTFGHSLTAGFEINLSRSATTYGGLEATGVTYAGMSGTYGELEGASEERAIIAGTSNGTLAYFNSNATSDLGVGVESRWRSSALIGDDRAHQKTVNEWRVDYQGESSSSLTVKFSTNVGASFDVGTGIHMPSASVMAQGVAHPYFSAVHPVFQISSEGHRYRVFGFTVKFRRGGRAQQG
jgi:hypothetical protein